MNISVSNVNINELFKQDFVKLLITRGFLKENKSTIINKCMLELTNSDVIYDFYVTSNIPNIFTINFKIKKEDNFQTFTVIYEET